MEDGEALKNMGTAGGAEAACKQPAACRHSEGLFQLA